MKKCSFCNTEKELSEYHKNSRAKDGLQSSCKDCRKGINQKWKDNNRESYQRVKRKAHVKAKYGVSLEWIDEQLEQQDNKCTLCDTQLHKGKNIAIDHCHKTGIVRGIICRPCNSAMGMFNDNPALIERAIEYLKKGDLE